MPESGSTGRTTRRSRPRSRPIGFSRTCCRPCTSAGPIPVSCTTMSLPGSGWRGTSRAGRARCSRQQPPRHWGVGNTSSAPLQPTGQTRLVYWWNDANQDGFVQSERTRSLARPGRHAVTQLRPCEPGVGQVACHGGFPPGERRHRRADRRIRTPAGAPSDRPSHIRGPEDPPGPVDLPHQRRRLAGRLVHVRTRPLGGVELSRRRPMPRGHLLPARRGAAVRHRAPQRRRVRLAPRPEPGPAQAAGGRLDAGHLARVEHGRVVLPSADVRLHRSDQHRAEKRHGVLGAPVALGCRGVRIGAPAEGIHHRGRCHHSRGPAVRPRGDQSEPRRAGIDCRGHRPLRIGALPCGEPARLADRSDGQCRAREDRPGPERCPTCSTRMRCWRATVFRMRRLPTTSRGSSRRASSTSAPA